MPARRLRPNRLPVPPPMRRSSVHSPAAGSGRGQESALERVRRISREHNKPFDPSKRGTWKGSSKDLVVNASHRKSTRGAWSEEKGHHQTEEEFIVIESEPDDRHPYVLVNPLEVDAWQKPDLYAMYFGAYGTTRLLIWAGALESAIDPAVEWLAQYAPGHLSSEEDVAKLMEEVREEEPGIDDEAAYDKATADLYYTESGYLTSYEWTGDELRANDPIYVAALEASLEEVKAQNEQAPNKRGTQWSDAMILQSVRDGDMMTPQATERARELSRLGLIDTSGTWTLTPAGKRKLDEQEPNKRGAHRKNASTSPTRLNEFQQGFLESALWSSTDNADDSGGEPLDANYGVSDIAPETLASLLKDCDDFCEANAELLEQAGDDAQNGHDFWLTRNGHGVGFRDRGYGAVGKELSAACKPYGSVDLYVGDDGKIYGE